MDDITLGNNRGFLTPHERGKKYWKHAWHNALLQYIFKCLFVKKNNKTIQFIHVYWPPELLIILHRSSCLDDPGFGFYEAIIISIFRRLSSCDVVDDSSKCYVRVSFQLKFRVIFIMFDVCVIWSSTTSQNDNPLKMEMIMAW
jgi:hypothetical protein